MLYRLIRPHQEKLPLITIKLSSAQALLNQTIYLKFKSFVIYNRISSYKCGYSHCYCCDNC